MIIAQHSVYLSASHLNAVWSYYSDVAHWKTWDHDLDYAHIEEGGFKKEGRGELKPKSGPKTSFILSEVVAKKSFTVTSRLPGATMHFYHHLRQRNHDFLEITHRVEMVGWSAPFFNVIIGRGIRKGLPKSLARLAAMIEKGTQWHRQVKF